MKPRGPVNFWENLGLLADHPIIEGDGERSEGLLSSIVRGADDLGQGFMDRGDWSYPSSWPGYLGGAIVKGVTTPFRHSVDGEDVTVGDVGMAAAEAIPAIGPARRGISKAAGWAARPQNITQRISKSEMDEGKKPLFGDWYQNWLAPYLRAGAMPVRAGTNMIRRLASPDADALYRKHKISPAQKDEFLKQLDWAEKNAKSQSNMNDNELISQMQYLDVVAQKYGGPQFTADVKKLLNPKSTTTTGDDLAISGIPVARIVDSNLPSRVIKDHMSAPMVKSLGLKGKDVLLNTKALNERSPIATLLNSSNRPGGQVKVGNSPAFPDKGNSTYFFHGTEGRYNPAATAMMLWKKIPENEPFTLGNLLKAGKEHNRQVKEGLLEIEAIVESLIKRNKDGSISRAGLPPGKDSVDKAFEKASELREIYLRKHPFVDLDHLEGAAKQSDGYISFQGRVLGEDRLLGHYNLRTVIKEGTNEGHVFVSDEMALGLTSKVDDVLGAGTPEWVGVDLIPLKKSDTMIQAPTSAGAAATQRGIPTIRETSLQIQKELRAMLGVKATAKDKAITAAKVITAAGATYATANTIWGDDSP